MQPPAIILALCVLNFFILLFPAVAQKSMWRQTWLSGSGLGWLAGKGLQFVPATPDL
jgi:hypothetical protein